MLDNNRCDPNRLHFVHRVNRTQQKCPQRLPTNVHRLSIYHLFLTAKEQGDGPRRYSPETGRVLQRSFPAPKIVSPGQRITIDYRVEWRQLSRLNGESWNSITRFVIKRKLQLKLGGCCENWLDSATDSESSEFMSKLAKTWCVGLGLCPWWTAEYDNVQERLIVMNYLWPSLSPGPAGKICFFRQCRPF